MYHIFFIHSSVDRHLGCFHALAIGNSAAMNIGVHVSFRVMVFSRYMPRSGIAGSYGSSIFSFWRNLCIVLHSDCTSLHSHHSVGRFPFLYTLSSTSFPAFIICRFLMMAILTGVRWYLIVVLICISWILAFEDHIRALTTPRLPCWRGHR